MKIAHLMLKKIQFWWKSKHLKQILRFYEYSDLKIIKIENKSRVHDDNRMMKFLNYL